MVNICVLKLNHPVYVEWIRLTCTVWPPESVKIDYFFSGIFMNISKKKQLELGMYAIFTKHEIFISSLIRLSQQHKSSNRTECATAVTGHLHNEKRRTKIKKPGMINSYWKFRFTLAPTSTSGVPLPICFL